MEEFILYAYNFRSRSERVLWTLRELAFPHKVIRLDPFKGETNTPEMLALNPSRKMPVLTQGDRVFTESLPIMEYLNEISDGQALVPDTPYEHYQYRRLIHYGETEIEPYLWIAEQATRLSFIYRWPQGADKDARHIAQQNFDALWPMVNEGDYIAGDRFTLADIYYYQMIRWAETHKIQFPENKRQAIADYLKRLQDRPAFPEEMRGKP